MEECVDDKALQLENLFIQFLKSFRLPEDGPGNHMPYYEMEVEAMSANQSTTMLVDFSHVMRFNDVLHMAISEEFFRLEPNLRSACKRFIMEVDPAFLRKVDPKNDINVGFYNLPSVKQLRELGPEEIGKLVALRGVVTWTGEVRLELLQGTFKCLDCGTVVRDVEQQLKYTEPVICMNATCQNRNKWELLKHDSKFTDWQRVRVQETSMEIPAGSISRSLDVILRHDIVEQAGVGDTVVFTGTVVVIPGMLALASREERAECQRDSSCQNGMAGEEGKGLSSLGTRDLSYRLGFIVNSVQIADGRRNPVIRYERDAVEDDELFTSEELIEIQEMRNTPEFFNKLVDSIAPTVFGHQDIKRAILLMLMCGVHKVTHEGINIRGNINVCIVGHPSCAKSQLLKYTAGLLPRSVYISGMSSSAAVLTATVAKEPETGEFCIEAGALMLADNGICCIDMFDKMDKRDQVAIHEAMEQQTVSITKAGIQVTFNARTSILAAAHPIEGCYDKTKPLEYYVALPPAILSSFDLVYVMNDDPEEHTDYRIAHHILRDHQKREETPSPAFSTAQIKRYISYAKTMKPELTLEARKLLVKSYISLRIGDTTPGSRVAYQMTVRQLEALIRLSESIARCHLDAKVRPRHVHLAVRLLKTSIISLESSGPDLIDFQEDNNDGGIDGNEDKASVPEGYSCPSHEAPTT